MHFLHDGYCFGEKRRKGEEEREGKRREKEIKKLERGGNEGKKSLVALRIELRTISGRVHIDVNEIS